MQGAKPEIKKPVSLENLLMGIKHNIYEPDFGTIVKISCETNCSLNGHRAWLRSMMPTWVKQLNTYSGGRVKSWSINRERRTLNFQINMEMFFVGSINEHNMHPKTAKMLSGQMRKLIAMEVITAYPPPFDVREPLFAAGSFDLLQIELRNRHESEIKAFTAGIQDVQVISDISGQLEENNCQFIKIFKNSRGFMEYGLLFKWKKAVTKDERSSSTDPLRRFLHEKFHVHPSLNR